MVVVIVVVVVFVVVVFGVLVVGDVMCVFLGVYVVQCLSVFFCCV